MINTTAAKDEYATPIEIARELRCSSTHVRRLIHAGHLQGYRVGGLLIVPREAVRKFLENNTTAQAA